LNAPLLFNITLPGQTPGYISAGETEITELTLVPGDPNSLNSFGPIGQLNIAGFSPVGLDVFNFPQQRENETYQIADTLRWQTGRHSFAFGADFRRTYLRSDLPRNSRPLVTFNGSLAALNGQNACGGFCSPTDLAAAGAASGFFQSLVLPGNDATIDLRYNQINLFGMDDWQLRSNLRFSFGLRYEYNSPPSEADRKIENSFTGQQFPSFVSGLSRFIDGRTRIFDPDKNNFAPRVGFAYAPTGSVVIRGGYGIYYDQILGAVVSQSRNVFPTFSTINFGGGLQFGGTQQGFLFNPFNPLTAFFGTNPIIAPGTVNTIDSRVNVPALLQSIFEIFPSQNGTSFGATLPRRALATPMSHQYYLGTEIELSDNVVASLAYVGTSGRNLLRFTTPNLGPNYLPVITDIFAVGFQPVVRGVTFSPASNPATLDRPVANIGPIEQFESTGRSQYHSMQLGIRGTAGRNFQFGANYVLGRVRDDVSDVFDLAGAPALPQNSLTFAGEYADANFDVRHRFTYNFNWALPRLNDRSDVVRHIFGGWELAGQGKFNTGQPFTVNSIFDVNLDGNLTDRLDNFQFINETGNRGAPLALTCTVGLNCQAMLAPRGRDGVLPRNSFRAGSLLEMDIVVSRRFRISETQNIQFRVDFFNFINRANYGIPVRFLGFPGFGRANDTITPGRRIQFALKYNF
jgi:hypothetical protein